MINRVLDNVRNVVRKEVESLDFSKKRVSTYVALQYIFADIRINNPENLGNLFRYTVTIENVECEMIDYNYFKEDEVDKLVEWVVNYYKEKLPKERLVTQEQMEKYALEKYEEGGHAVVECWTQENFDEYLRWYRTKSDLDTLFGDYNEYFNRF